MRTRETISCSHCDAPWDSRTARYCGACGHALTAPALPPAEGPRRRHGIRIAALTTVGTLAFTAAVAANLDLRLPTRAPDPSVALADEGAVPRGRPVSPELRDTLLAPFDPNRLRCEPAGCERWRIDFDDDMGSVTTFGDLVAVMVDGEVIALDALTGEEVWRAPTETQGDWTQLLPSANHRYLAVISNAAQSVQIIDRDGAIHGSATRARGQLAGALFVGDDVLVVGTTARRFSYGGSTDGPDVQDRVHAWTVGGDALWTHEQSGFLAVTDDAVVVREGEDAVLVDAATGEQRGREPLPDDAWLYAEGRLLIESGSPSRPARLRSAEDLRVLPVSEELREVWPVMGHGLAIGVRRPPPADTDVANDTDDAPVSTLVLVDEEGVIRWESDLGSILTSSCCPQAFVDGESLLLAVPTATGGDGPVWRSLATGDELIPPPDARPRPDVPGDGWWIGSHTAIRHEEVVVHEAELEAAHSRLLLYHEDAAVTVSGSGWLVANDPPFVVTNGRTLLGVEPVAPAG